jgi:hypothetical protein
MPILSYTPFTLTNRKLFDVPSASRSVFFVGASDWHRLAAGFKNAADILVERLTKDGRAVESVSTAALFQYRHSVELSLKGMLLDAGEVLDVPDLAPSSHPLLPIWVKLRQRMVQVGDPGSDAWLDRAEELIRELDSIDSGSFAFRYPVDTRGIPQLPPFGVDMAHFRSVMDELTLILNSCGDWLDAHVGWKREMDEYGY